MSGSGMRGIRRKKSSMSEVKIAVIGAPGVGKSGEWPTVVSGQEWWVGNGGKCERVVSGQKWCGGTGGESDLKWVRKRKKERKRKNLSSK